MRPLPGIHDQRYGQVHRRMRGLLHHRAGAGGQLVHRAFLHLEQQFVMDLQQHPCGQPLDGRLHPDHRAADDVGGRPLDRRVDRGALRKARRRPLGIDLGRVDFPAEQRLDVKVLLREGLGFVHVIADAGEAFEIAVDEALRLGPRDAQVARKTEARDAVDHPEIDRLGLPPHFGRHLVERHVEHFQRGGGVDVLPLLERLFQRVDPGDVRQNPQLDLAVIEADQHAARLGDEGFANAPPILGAHGDVLQVRVGRGQPPGVRPRDGIGGVDAPRIRVDMVLQRIRVGRFQL